MRVRDVLKYLLPVCIIPIVVGVCWSCSPKIVREIRTEIQYRDRVVPIVATIDIPYFVERNVTQDTLSRLENPFARSEARVSRGLLYHSLETIPQTIEKPIEVHVTDTLWKESEVVTEIKEVEKPLSKWKSFKLDCFWWLILTIAALLGWIFRKPLLKLLSKLF